MTTAEIRHDIIKKVFTIDDDESLTKILSFLDLFQAEQGSWWEQLSEVQKAKIEQSSKDAAAGIGKPYNQVRTEVRHWFESKNSI